VSSLANLPELAALYPFAGMEFIFAIGLAAFLVMFLMKQIAMEYNHQKAILGESKQPAPASSAAGLAPAE
jgi:hypothetical protein